MIPLGIPHPLPFRLRTRHTSWRLLVRRTVIAPACRTTRKAILYDDPFFVVFSFSRKLTPLVIHGLAGSPFR